MSVDPKVDWSSANRDTAPDAPPPVVPRTLAKDPKTGRFEKGNSGRLHGSRHSTTLAVEKLMVDEAGALTRRCIDLAKAGDPTAMKIVMDRIAPVRRGRSLPRLQRETGEGSIEAILRAVLDGEITPEEGKSVTSLIESAAQVAAAQALAEVRKRQLKLLEQAGKDGLTAGGVMLVPLIDCLNQWEIAAQTAQHTLKAKVKE